MRLIVHRPRHRLIPLGTFTLPDDPRPWFESQTREHRFWDSPSSAPAIWFLAHADDGVIWGVGDGQTLRVGHSVRPADTPALRTVTLRTARLFTPHTELLIWRQGPGWSGRLLTDLDPLQGTEETIDESQMLWGTDGERVDDTFVRMTDGEQGLCHVVPQPAAAGKHGDFRPLRLGVRHYLTPDDHGVLRVTLSRLTDLWTEKKAS